MSKPFLLQRLLVVLSKRFLNANYSTRSQAKPRVNYNLIYTAFNIPIRYTQTTSQKCWNCGVEKKNVADLFCGRCGVIQYPHDTHNYFSVFGLDSTFDIDLKALQQKYRQMQSLLHPDKFSNSTDTERKISEEYSSLVNKAYNNLQVPLSRALHLLLLNNQRIEEGEQNMNSEFLMNMMELNEEVDNAVSPEALKKVSIKNKNMMEEVIEEISSHFKNRSIDKAKECIIRMKFYNSISKRINDLLREKGIVD